MENILKSVLRPQSVSQLTTKRIQHVIKKEEKKQRKNGKKCLQLHFTVFSLSSSSSFSPSFKSNPFLPHERNQTECCTDSAKDSFYRCLFSLAVFCFLRLPFDIYGCMILSSGSTIILCCAYTFIHSLTIRFSPTLEPTMCTCNLSTTGDNVKNHHKGFVCRHYQRALMAK